MVEVLRDLGFQDKEIWRISVRLSYRSEVIQNKINFVNNCPQWGLSTRPALPVNWPMVKSPINQFSGNTLISSSKRALDQNLLKPIFLSFLSFWESCLQKETPSARITNRALHFVDWYLSRQNHLCPPTFHVLFSIFPEQTDDTAAGLTTRHIPVTLITIGERYQRSGVSHRWDFFLSQIGLDRIFLDPKLHVM